MSKLPTIPGIPPFNLPLYNAIFARGLCHGVGERGGQMCVEAALCEALGLPHADDPMCVIQSVRSYKGGRR